ncbi:MAG: hypothetical protein QOD68_490 [Actinomycetota bacterium]|jgi:uncharacterized protein (TIGR02271 family)|nr:hypothetical protein [Actinomycetota bacterium]
MITQNQVRDLIGSELLDANGDKIGKIGQIFLDDQTGQPEWATVNTGLFGSNESFVPLADADVTGDALRVSYDKDKVKDAPNVDVDGGHLDETQEADLYRYYGLEYTDRASDRGPTTGTMDRGAGHDTSGRNTDEAMTRSEEQVHAGTEKVTSGKARLRKWVETEDVDVKVPVKKEKARLVTEPITNANRDSALDGPDITEEEHEVTLTEERPVVAKETVPVERVKLTKDTEQTEEQVSEQVRKERIEADGDVDLNEGQRNRTS